MRSCVACAYSSRYAAGSMEGARTRQLPLIAAAAHMAPAATSDTTASCCVLHTGKADCAACRTSRRVLSVARYETLGDLLDRLKSEPALCVF